MVESARLESVYTFIRIAGSNPVPSSKKIIVNLVTMDVYNPLINPNDVETNEHTKPRVVKAID